MRAGWEIALPVQCSVLPNQLPQSTPPAGAFSYDYPPPRAAAAGARCCRALGLLRCRLVTDEGLCMLAHYCRQLESLRLHDCPGVSDMSLVEVGV